MHQNYEHASTSSINYVAFLGSTAETLRFTETIIKKIEDDDKKEIFVKLVKIVNNSEGL